jgi:alpha-L-arabinofuranosidase
LTNYNTINAPMKISPSESTIKIDGGRLSLKMEPFSFKVLRIKK